MVRARIRALERKLVMERVEQRVCFRVEELVKEWSWAIYQDKPAPDPMVFAGEIINEGFYLPTFPRTLRYLEDCQSGGTAPEGKALFKRLLPWSTYPVCE